MTDRPTAEEIAAACAWLDARDHAIRYYERRKPAPALSLAEEIVTTARSRGWPGVEAAPAAGPDDALLLAVAEATYERLVPQIARDGVKASPEATQAVHDGLRAIIASVLGRPVRSVEEVARAVAMRVRERAAEGGASDAWLDRIVREECGR